jgi:chromosome segregation ATPase
VVLLVAAAALVGAAVAAGGTALVAVAGIVAVLLGAVATKITHSELVVSRREANRDRAAQAQAYAALTEERIAENRAFTEGLTNSVERERAERAKTVAELEAALAAAHQRAAEAIRSRAEEARKAAEAQVESSTLRQRVADAESRAADAIVRVAELEQELEVVRAELTAAKAAAKKGISAA